MNAWIGRKPDGPSSASRHNLVLLGDGYLEGLGDAVSIGEVSGPTSRLPELIARKPAIRQRWQVTSIAQAYTTSHEWLAEHVAGPAWYSHTLLFGSTTSMWEQLQRHYSDGQVYVLSVGAVDMLPTHPFAGDPESILRNVTQIVAQLQLLDPGVRILIVPPPIHAPVLQPARDKVAELIESLLRDLANGKTVLVGPVMSTASWARGDLYLGSDRLHFSARGYKKFSSELADQLQSMMTAVEWQYLSGMLKEQVGVEDTGATGKRRRQRGKHTAQLRET